jgi:alanyl-tRNA synthetase
MRHAHLLGAKEPLMHRLVPALVAEMGGAYPELVRAQAAIESTLMQEETQFRRTLQNGLKLLDEATAGMGAGDTLPGEVAFKLYDTFGFPYDLTEDALRVSGLGVDRAGFDEGMARQKAMARAAWKGSGAKAADDVWFDIAEREGSTEFIGYGATEGDGQVVSILVDGVEQIAPATVAAPASVTILTNQTPFYAESGGQNGDAGIITSDGNLRAVVEDTAKPLGRLHAHHVKLDSGSISVGDTIHLSVDVARRNRIRANHSATHLLHSALRNTLGDHVTQKGSMVAEDRLRFDFSHNSALSPVEVAAIEAEVNAEIRGNQPVSTRLMTPDDAVAAGALALFGEKYGDEVRVLTMGPKADARAYSVELCGGTHVSALGDIALFKIISEGAVASGIRRIEAMTGEAARLWLTDREDRLKEVATSLKTSPEDVPARVATLSESVRKLEKDLAEAKKALALGSGTGGADSSIEREEIGKVNFYAKSFKDLDPKDLRGVANETREKLGSGIYSFTTENDGKASIMIAVSDDLVSSNSAVILVRAGVLALGGQGGGGKPELAQGGGPNGDAVEEAIKAVKFSIKQP